MSQNIIPSLRGELCRIADQFEKADADLLKARTTENIEAEADARGEAHAAAEMLADLGMLFFRYAASYRPTQLKIWLEEIVQSIMEPELRQIIGMVKGKNNGKSGR